MFLHTWHPHALIVSIGQFQIHWYGLLLAVAMLVGIWLVQWIGNQYQLDQNRLFDLALIVIVIGFLGARLYHVLNEWQYYTGHPVEMLKVWKGGLALHGGLIFGAAALWFMSRRWKWNPWLIADIIAPAIAVGQAIGRWGNYFNQELFGKPTKLPWGIPIDDLLRPIQYVQYRFFHPTFLYESAGLVLVAIILIWLHRRRWIQPAKPLYGSIALLYVMLYSVLRLATESLRIDQTPIIGHVRLPILVSGALITVAAALLIIRYRRHVRA